MRRPIHPQPLPYVLNHAYLLYCSHVLPVVPFLHNSFSNIRAKTQTGRRLTVSALFAIQNFNRRSKYENHVCTCNWCDMVLPRQEGSSLLLGSLQRNNDWTEITININSTANQECDHRQKQDEATYCPRPFPRHATLNDPSAQDSEQHSHYRPHHHPDDRHKPMLT